MDGGRPRSSTSRASIARSRAPSSARACHVTAHVDTPSGRGTARLALDALAGSTDAIADRALELAHAGIGPAWTSPAPAAPARVDLDDGSLHDPAVAAKAALPAHPGTTASIRTLREDVSVTTHAGFHYTWPATLIRARRARSSRRSLALGDARLAYAATASRRSWPSPKPRTISSCSPRAHEPVAGPCTLVLTADAMLHDGLGVWSAFIPQADASIERQGLTRYREHAPIAAGATTAIEPLTIGATARWRTGCESSPLGDDGEAVRRFRSSSAASRPASALSPREAALRARDPNGGVRNLVVAPGTWDGARPASACVEVRRLRAS